MYGFSAVLNINTTTQKTHLKQKNNGECRSIRRGRYLSGWLSFYPVFYFQIRNMLEMFYIIRYKCHTSRLGSGSY